MKEYANLFINNVQYQIKILKKSLYMMLSRKKSVPFLMLNLKPIIKDNKPLTYFHHVDTNVSETLDVQSDQNLISHSEDIKYKKENLTQTNNLPLEIIKFISTYLNYKDKLILSETSHVLCNYMREICGLILSQPQIEEFVNKSNFKFHTVISLTVKLDRKKKSSSHNLIIQTLDKFQFLTYLNLKNCFLDKDAFSKLKLPKGLLRINLSYNIIKNADWDKLLTPEKLNTLELEGSELSDADMTTLVKIKTLTSLDITFNDISDLSSIIKFSNLKNLYVIDIKLNIDSLSGINLKLLIVDLSENNIKDENMELFNQFLSLNILKLNKNLISQLGISKLKILSLKRLELIGNRITKLDKQSLSGLEQLEELNVSENKNLARHTDIPKRIKIRI